LAPGVWVPLVYGRHLMVSCHMMQQADYAVREWSAISPGRRIYRITARSLHVIRLNLLMLMAPSHGVWVYEDTIPWCLDVC
jgi:hypothetical protein